MWYMWIHPVIQAAATLLGLYVISLGWVRFRAAFLGRKGMFKWKRHVALGKTVVAVWALGMVTGLLAAHNSWRVMFITGTHARLGLAMVPFMVFAWATGWLMDRHKKKRKAMPLAHAVNGLILVLMALHQGYTGIAVLRDFVIP